MANCSDNSYYIFFTDKCKGLPLCSEVAEGEPCCNLDIDDGPLTIGESIHIEKSQLVQDKADITFLGKTRLEYGEVFDENMLHLLENFAAPQNGTGLAPDTTEVNGTIFQHTAEGQVWHNTSINVPFVYGYDKDDEEYYWQRLGTFEDVAGNHGVIVNGETIPLPESLTGETYSADECTFMVSPVFWGAPIKSFACTVDASGYVVATYVTMDDNVNIGRAFYTVLAIRSPSEG